MHDLFLEIFTKLHIQEEKPQRKLDNFDSFVKPLTLKEVRAKRDALEQNISSLQKTDPSSEKTLRIKLCLLSFSEFVARRTTKFSLLIRISNICWVVSFFWISPPGNSLAKPKNDTKKSAAVIKVTFVFMTLIFK